MVETLAYSTLEILAEGFTEERAKEYRVFPRRMFYIVLYNVDYLTSSFNGVLSFTSLKRKEHHSSFKTKNTNLWVKYL